VIKRGLTIGLLAVSLMAANGAMAQTTFTDIGSNWAKDAITWGADQGFVHGYPDGTFKPNNKVNEAEFLALLIGAYHPKDFTASAGTSHWADSFYTYARTMNYPTSSNRDATVSRTHVAEMVAATQGVNYKGADAIKYLLVNGLAKGKGGAPTVENFKGNDGLARGESVAFIQNVMEKGVKDALPTPAQPSDTAKLNQQYQLWLQQNNVQPTPAPAPVQTTTDVQAQLDKAKNSEALFPSVGVTQDQVNKMVDLSYEIGKKSGMVNGKFRVYLPQAIPDNHYVDMDFENGLGTRQTFSFGKPKGKEIPTYLDFDVDKSKEIHFGVFIQAVYNKMPFTYAGDGWNSKTNDLYVGDSIVGKDYKLGQ
jgi:hypothetical protein